MKQNLKYLATYLPWLLVLLVFDLFTAILLWLSDVRMFQALILLYLLATVLLFFILSLLLIRKERKKSAAYKAFIANPKIDTELELLRLSTVSEKESLEEIAEFSYLSLFYSIIIYSRLFYLIYSKKARKKSTQFTSLRAAGFLP